MPTYRFVWPAGYSAHMTVPQYERACIIAQQFELPHTVTVFPISFDSEAVGIKTPNLFIVVFPDGSSHS